MNDCLATDATNPFYYGYMQDCEAQEARESIENECGICIPASVLIEELEKKGLDTNSAAPHQHGIVY